MIFVTRHYMEPHGSARSARDFIHSALSCGESLHVVSPCDMDEALLIPTFTGGAPSWHRYSGFSLFDRFPGPRRSMRFLREQLCRLTVRSFMARDWTVVNGWASVHYWRKLKGGAEGSNALIVRESPRHFDFADRTGLATQSEMLCGLAEFDRLIFVSERVRDEWTNFDELSQIPTFVLPNCCEEEEIEQLLQQPNLNLRLKLGIPDRAFLVTLVGSIELRKGHDILLSAFTQLMHQVPGAHVLLVGNATTDWGRQLLDTISASYAEHVTHLAAQSSALPYLLASDVIAVPSRAEALPRTILEAMCLGKAIVASDVDGIPELIDHGRQGLLFKNEDPEALAAALQLIASDPTAPSRYGANARARYYRDFSRSAQVARMGELRAWLQTGTNEPEDVEDGHH